MLHLEVLLLILFVQTLMGMKNWGLFFAYLLFFGWMWIVEVSWGSFSLVHCLETQLDSQLLLFRILLWLALLHLFFMYFFIFQRRILLFNQLLMRYSFLLSHFNTLKDHISCSILQFALPHFIDQ